MHDAAIAWVAAHAKPSKTVLDIGGRDVNGSPRHLYPDADYVVVDLQAGANVDVVADITTWKTRRRFDTVLCLEVLEHAENWRDILDAAIKVCRHHLIVTAAGPGRPPHSAVDGGPLKAGEFYANIRPGELADALSGRGSRLEVDTDGQDVRAVIDL